MAAAKDAAYDLSWVVDALVTELCEDSAFDMHRAAKTGALSLEELYAPSLAEAAAAAAADAAADAKALAAGARVIQSVFFFLLLFLVLVLLFLEQQQLVDVSGALQPTVRARARRHVRAGATPRGHTGSIVCGHCGQKVGVSRYAPHLDKCMMGNRRGSNSSRSSNSSSSSSSSSSSGSKAGRKQAASASDRTMESPPPIAGSHVADARGRK